MNFFSSIDGTTLFFALAIGAAFFYALQNALLANYSRQMGGLSTAVYRNLSFIVTMAPVLLLVPLADIVAIAGVWHYILGSAILGAAGLSLSLSANKYLPLGIVSTIAQLSPVFLIGWSFFVFGEIITVLQALFIFVVICAVIFVGIQKHALPHLDSRSERGILLMIAATLIGSLGFVFVTLAARQVNPIVVGYFWEISIGLVAFIIICLRGIFFKKFITPLRPREFGRLALCASPTVIGSMAFPYAMSIGNPGVAHSVLGASSIVFMMLLGMILYSEKMQPKQLFGATVIVVSIICLRLVS